MTATWTVGLDAVNISLVDVHPGYERAFHDWYESDHFYAGGVLAPGVLSGRKWYAPAALRTARYVAADSPFPDRDAGTNLATYFQNQPSGYETFQEWVMPQLVELRAAGRMFTERTPVNIGFWTFEGVVDAATRSSVPPLVALEHPFAAAALVYATTDGRAASSDGEVPPGTLTLRLSPRPADVPNVSQADLSTNGQVTLLLAFLAAPQPTDAERTAGLVRAIAGAAGLRPLWGGVFLPVAPGDPSYVDTIRPIRD